MDTHWSTFAFLFFFFRAKVLAPLALPLSHLAYNKDKRRGSRNRINEPADPQVAKDDLIWSTIFHDIINLSPKKSIKVL